MAVGNIRNNMHCRRSFTRDAVLFSLIVAHRISRVAPLLHLSSTRARAHAFVPSPSLPISTLPFHYRNHINLRALVPFPSFTLTRGFSALSLSSIPSEFSDVTLKLAFDSTLAIDNDGPPGRFTSPKSLDAVHRLRACSDAVLVGVGTVLRDDPTLTVRRGVEVSCQPVRVVVDPWLRMWCTPGGKEAADADWNVITDGSETVVYHFLPEGLEGSGEKLKHLQDVLSSLKTHPPSPNVSMRGLPCGPSGGISVRSLLADLRNRGVSRVMVEGGPDTAARFLSEECVDRALLVHAKEVTFESPVRSGWEDVRYLELLEGVGNLKLIGKYKVEEGNGDVVECWVRKNDSKWPSEDFRDWP